VPRRFRSRLAEIRYSLTAANLLAAAPQNRAGRCGTGDTDLAVRRSFSTPNRAWVTSCSCPLCALASQPAGEVIVGVHRPLAAVMTAFPESLRSSPTAKALPNFDLYCPMMSLPLAFGTDLRPYPPLFPISGRTGRIDRWRERLAETGVWGRICWAGTAAQSERPRRSIPLSDFRQNPVVEGLDFVNLQKEVTEADAAI